MLERDADNEGEHRENDETLLVRCKDKNRKQSSHLFA
jgi:hypothetical protein